MLLALRFVRLPALRAERPRLEAVDESEVSVVTQVSDLGRVVCDAPSLMSFTALPEITVTHIAYLVDLRSALSIATLDRTGRFAATQVLEARLVLFDLETG